MSFDIDPELSQRADREPDAVVDAILVCLREVSDSLRKDLKEAGFEIVNLERADDGLIYGRQRLDHLEELRRMADPLPGLESISPDSEVHIQ